MAFELLGGVGLFLLGMVLLTEGLKAFAGDALRQALMRFTGSPLKAFASGVLVTAVVQSSSATTVAVIGFVSAGLLSFTQAVAVVIGASLGTTGTSWIVSVLGLQISVGYYALPLVGIGAFMHLFARGRWKSLGMALAGFGLIFVGIQTLQQGMQSVSDRFVLAEVPSVGVAGHLLMAAIGIAMTVVMQSSSAAVATTLTALHTNSVSFDQAASLVIGAAIGTTVTGALAAVGANVSAKRTALAHVTFNLATGLVAVLMLPLFLRGIQWAQENFGLEPGAISLALFHTAFIGVGVVLFLPFVNQFARWIERILPETGPVLTRHLDQSVLNVPTVALEATRRALIETACATSRILSDCLSSRWQSYDERIAGQLRTALEQTQQFLAKIPPISGSEPMSQSRVSQIHAIDHLLRLQSSLQPPASIIRVLPHDRLREELEYTQRILELAETGLRAGVPDDWLADVERLARELAERRRLGRPGVLRETAHGGWDYSEALQVLDAMRWLDRIGYHIWRACNYLGGNGAAAPDAEAHREHYP